ncbi:MAG: acetate--CoA ligase [Marinilabiliales bacterium]|nr:acetate--CoA ligase [Marinilabiliales bacterium]
MEKNDAKPKWYEPSREVTEQANVKEYDQLYRYSIENREAFWAEQANQLSWYKKWDKVLDDQQAPFYNWFVGGRTNIILNAIDRHLKSATRNKLAVIWEGEPGDSRTFSYHALNREVSQFANILKSMGVRKGDVVTIYMPQIPEQLFAMLACAKIGAVHSVVYGGFSHEALADRINDANSRVVITADGGYRRGKVVEMKSVVNKAMELSPTMEICITVKRTGIDVYMENDRDYWLHDLKSLPIASNKCETEEMDASDMLFLLYTSGSTGRPKALVHTHGGYSVYTATTHRMVFDIKPEDRYWCAADPGWITGHSYIVYGPLINGSTIMLYEGAPNHPYPDRWWKMVEKYGINILYTSPTAIRGLMRFGDSWPNRNDISSLRLLGSVGEPINAEAWSWFHRAVGRGNCPIMDTWWQTETGGFIIAPLPITPLKPGSATKPFFGNELAIVDDAGKEVPDGEEGNLVIKSPWPGLAKSVFNDPQRFVDTYWSKYKEQGWYHTGDSAKKDEDGYYWIIGRNDDVIKVSGYRLGSAEIEGIMATHPAIVEAAAIALPHQLKGNAIHITAVLKSTYKPTKELEHELMVHMEEHLGKIARPEAIVFAEALPKTRSGKIMRRLLKSRALGLPDGDLSTMEE